MPQPSVRLPKQLSPSWPGRAGASNLAISSVARLPSSQQPTHGLAETSGPAQPATHLSPACPGPDASQSTPGTGPSAQHAKVTDWSQDQQPGPAHGIFWPNVPQPFTPAAPAAQPAPSPQISQHAQPSLPGLSAQGKYNGTRYGF